ncbi:hypothetical protein NC651_037773 [Populus alba x Populus x berolinensis]|nr:hypothetical protein NC651_037773 [Populus alba x Populus x berolinensis]
MSYLKSSSIYCNVQVCFVSGSFSV